MAPAYDYSDAHDYASVGDDAHWRRAADAVRDTSFDSQGRSYGGMQVEAGGEGSRKRGPHVTKVTARTLTVIFGTMLLVAALSAMAFFQEGSARITTSNLNTIESTTPEQAARMAYSTTTALEVAAAPEVATVGGQKLEAFYWEVEGEDEEAAAAAAAVVVVSDVEEGAEAKPKVAAPADPKAKKARLDHEHKSEELARQKAKAEAASDVTPPHIVYFLIDDQGYGDIGTESDLAFASPTFAKLANDGISLTNFYALHLCTPARAALLTGE